MEPFGAAFLDRFDAAVPRPGSGAWVELGWSVRADLEARIWPQEKASGFLSERKPAGGSTQGLSLGVWGLWFQG